MTSLWVDTLRAFRNQLFIHVFLVGTAGQTYMPAKCLSQPVTVFALEAEADAAWKMEFIRLRHNLETTVSNTVQWLRSECSQVSVGVHVSCPLTNTLERLFLYSWGVVHLFCTKGYSGH